MKGVQVAGGKDVACPQCGAVLEAEQFSGQICEDQAGPARCSQSEAARCGANRVRSDGAGALGPLYLILSGSTSCEEEK